MPSKAHIRKSDISKFPPDIQLLIADQMAHPPKPKRPTKVAKPVGRVEAKAMRQLEAIVAKPSPKRRRILANPWLWFAIGIAVWWAILMLTR